MRILHFSKMMKDANLIYTIYTTFDIRDEWSLTNRRFQPRIKRCFLIAGCCTKQPKMWSRINSV
jgi:hypothetical protein